MNNGQVQYDIATNTGDQAGFSWLSTNTVAFFTLLYKEVRRILRIWVQTIIPPAITMTLYFVIFGSLIGRRIGEIDGVPYMTFIAPGLIMMAVITNSFGNVVSSFFSGKLQLHLEELLVAPISAFTIVLGYVLGGVFRGLLVAALVTAVALFFTDISVAHPLITIAVIILTAMVFSLAGLLNALFAKNFDDITIIPTFVLTPLTYLGGVFFSISLLSETWQTVALANPVLYMVNAFRYGMLGSSDVSIAVAFSIILIALVVISTVVVTMLHKGIGTRV
jgi:ABC-2 type transport system permease protein